MPTASPSSTSGTCQRPPSQTWRTFLANHAHHFWAADQFTVHNLTFKTLYVLVYIAHGRRENPTAAWVWRQMIEATTWGNQPRHLLHDRDADYRRDFRQRARRIGIDSIATPVRSPRANAIVERLEHSAESVWTASSCWTSPTCCQYSANSSRTTTRTIRIAPLDSTHPSCGHSP